jgi:hypothetical protein
MWHVVSRKVGDQFFPELLVKLYNDVAIVDVRMINECGTVGGMRIDMENRRTLRKPAPVPLRSPQIPHE